MSALRTLARIAAVNAVTCTLWAQVVATPGHPLADNPSPCIVTSVKTAVYANLFQVEVTAGCKLSPKSVRLSNPERWVFDFPDTEVPKTKRIEVRSGPVLAVRLAQFQADPPVGRLVVDLRQAVNYQIETSGTTLLIKFPLEETGTLPQKPSSPTFQHAPAVLSDLSVTADGPEFKVQIRLSKAVTPQILNLQGPARMVIDLPNTVPGAVRSALAVNLPQLKAVRVGLNRSKPPLTRVVLDLLSADLSPGISASGSTIVIQGKSVAQLSADAGQPRDRLPDVTVPSIPSNSVILASPQLNVTVDHGLLTVQSQKASFDTVLREIAAKTGAQLILADRNAEETMARVAAQPVVVGLGPALPRDIVSDFLQGTEFGFMLTEDDKGDLQKIVLLAGQSAKPAVGARAAAGNQPPIAVSEEEEPMDTMEAQVTIVSPKPDSAVAGPVALSVNTTPNVIAVQFTLDGVNIGTELTAPPYSVLWNSSGTLDGGHILMAIGRDSLGNSVFSQPVLIKIDNASHPDKASGTISDTEAGRGR